MALLAFKRAYRAAGLEVSADELPDHLCVVLEFSATGRRRGGHAAAARAPGRSGAAPARAGRPRLPVGRRADRRLLDAPAAARRRAGGRGAGWPPRARRGSRSASSRYGAMRGHGMPAMSARPALGGHPVRVPGVLRARARVAVPVRQVRLDHALVAALREPAAALGQPAVPLRHPGGVPRARDGPGHPGELDVGRRDLRGAVPLHGRDASGRSRGSARSSASRCSSTAGARSGRCSARRRGWTRSCTCSSRW